MKNDFDFIKEKFDSDNIIAPDSINEFNILDKLDTAEQKKIKLYQKPAFKGVVSAVACLAIAIGIFSYVSNSNKEPQYVTKEGSALSSFASYNDIYKVIKDKNNFYLYSNTDGGLGNLIDFNMKGDIAKETIDDSTAFESDISINNSENFGDTYKQVDGVDESDIIKNDGRYIYALDNDHNTIKIYEGTKLIATIDDFKDNGSYDNVSEVYEYINNMYIHNNKLIIEITFDDYRKDNTITLTKICIYDLTDITSPKLLKSFSQSGSIMSSRMVGDELYMVTNTYITRYKAVDDCIIYDGEDNTEKAIPADDICCIDEPSEPNYIIIGAIDTNSCERTAETKALFGCGDTLYSNDKNMYIVAYENNETVVIKATFSRDKIEFIDKVSIGNGYINNQFSMDEYDGYFRIATSDENGNNIFIFDDKLSKVGEIKGIAKDENIQAVRFMGDLAYIITFRNTDPLFVIDLSNPAKPKLLGEVEITGFSSQLVPVDENTILGIGEISTTDNNGNFINGLKLVLFDVSDKSNPKVLDTKSFKDTDSTAQYNHKAIVVNKKDGYYALDFASYHGAVINYGAITFEIKDNKIVMTNNFVIEPTNDFIYSVRCTYIDDTIYILDNNADIYSFKY